VPYVGGTGLFPDTPEGKKKMMDAAAGFGLGGSAIAMFGRVGGGIYTKAADVGGPRPSDRT
jgi:K(+)-stimulated pyrophosphate-energized sodium pump